MTATELRCGLCHSVEVEWCGFVEATKEVLLRHVPSGRAYAFPAAAIATNTWPTIEAVVTGARRARVLTHYSRIVGYYSELGNWNTSKLAELKDRRRGDYAV